MYGWMVSQMERIMERQTDKQTDRPMNGCLHRTAKKRMIFQQILQFLQKYNGPTHTPTDRPTDQPTANQQPHQKHKMAPSNHLVLLNTNQPSLLNVNHHFAQRMKLKKKNLILRYCLKLRQGLAKRLCDAYLGGHIDDFVYMEA